MYIPNDLQQKRSFINWVIGICTASQDRRRSMYDKRRLYYLFGQNSYKTVRLNKLKSHLGLVSSFLYSPDGLQYSLAAPPNADDDDIIKYVALQDSLNDDMQNCGIADDFAEASLWGLTYDTMILKAGWNDISKQPFTQIMEPSSFGVFREDIADFSAQQAMCHSYNIDYDEAVQRLRRAGLIEMVKYLQLTGGDRDTGRPGTLSQLVITQSAGDNFQNNIIGQINPEYDASPTYVANTDNPLVRFHEVHVFDSAVNDYRMFHVLDPDIIIADSRDTIDALKRGKNVKFDSDTNFFLKGETPFVPVTPFPLYNYFWGMSHIEDLIPLQLWLTERLTQIDEVLQKQTDPAKVFSGFSGIADEKFAAMSQPGSWVADQMPNASVKELAPQMPPDLFAEFNEIQNLFLEQSGLTEILAGKSSGGARGGKQGKQLQVTGGGRIKRIATGLESSLVRLGDLTLKLKIKNDATRLKDAKGQEFVGAQLDDDYTLRCAGHSQSPLFSEETREIALTLFKAQAVDREALIRSFNPPNRDNLLHALRAREKAEAEAKAQAAAQGEDTTKRSHHKK